MADVESGSQCCQKRCGHQKRETTGCSFFGFQLFLVILTSPRRFWCPRGVFGSSGIMECSPFFSFLSMSSVIRTPEITDLLRSLSRFSRFSPIFAMKLTVFSPFIFVCRNPPVQGRVYCCSVYGRQFAQVIDDSEIDAEMIWLIVVYICRLQS
jgi:hypothetical protein